MSVIAGQTDPAQKPNTAVIKLLENKKCLLLWENEPTDGLIMYV